MCQTALNLKLNPHLHVIFLDGVYVASADGSLVFRPLSHPSTTDVADVLQIARARILRDLERRGAIQVEDDALHIDGAAWFELDPRRPTTKRR